MTDNRTTELRKALDFMRIWISDDAHLGESEFSYELEKAEGLRKLEAIEQAIAATLGGAGRVTCITVRTMTATTDGTATNVAGGSRLCGATGIWSSRSIARSAGRR